MHWSPKRSRPPLRLAFLRLAGHTRQHLLPPSMPPTSQRLPCKSSASCLPSQYRFCQVPLLRHTAVWAVHPSHFGQGASLTRPVSRAFAQIKKPMRKASAVSLKATLCRAKTATQSNRLTPGSQALELEAVDHADVVGLGIRCVGANGGEQLVDFVQVVPRQVHADLLAPLGFVR
jgi:hypothetical protein